MSARVRVLQFVFARVVYDSSLKIGLFQKKQEPRPQNFSTQRKRKEVKEAVVLFLDACSFFDMMRLHSLCIQRF